MGRGSRAPWHAAASLPQQRSSLICTPVQLWPATLTTLLWRLRMRFPSIIAGVTIIVTSLILPNFGGGEAQVTSNRQACTTHKVASPYGREIESKAGGYVSIPEYDQDGAEVGRLIFLESQFTTSSAGQLHLQPNQKPVTVFGSYVWNRGQLTRTVTDVKTGRTHTETLDAVVDDITGLCH